MQHRYDLSIVVVGTDVDAEGHIMRSVLKSGFFWQFAGGFVLGAIGLMTLQPADANRTLANQLATATHLTR